MAISGNFFGLRSGSTHSLTFQPRMMTLNEMRDRCAYAQCTSDRFQGTKNDNPSDAQLKQWAILANISHAKSLLRGKLAGCFGCASSKEAEKKFWQENIDGEQIIGAYPKQFLYSPIANYRFGDDTENPLVFRSLDWKYSQAVQVYRIDNRKYSSLSDLLPETTKLIRLDFVGPPVSVSINDNSFTLRATSIDVFTINVASLINAANGGYGTTDKYSFTHTIKGNVESLFVTFRSGEPIIQFTLYRYTKDFTATCGFKTIGFCLMPLNTRTGLYHGSWIRCSEYMINNDYITLEQAAESWRPNASFSYRYLNGGDEGFDGTQLPFPN